MPNWKQSFYVTALEALELKKNGIFIMTLNRISLLTFPHSSAVCKNDTMKLFNQPPVVLSYRPRHCCGIRPRLWAVSIVSNKKKLEKFNFFQVGSNCFYTTNISIWHFCHVLVSFGTFWWLSVKFIANIPWVKVRKSRHCFLSRHFLQKRTQEFYFATMKPQVDLFSLIFWRK